MMIEAMFQVNESTTCVSDENSQDKWGEQVLMKLYNKMYM